MEPSEMKQLITVSVSTNAVSYYRVFEDPTEALAFLDEARIYVAALITEPPAESKEGQ